MRVDEITVLETWYDVIDALQTGGALAPSDTKTHGAILTFDGNGQVHFDAIPDKVNIELSADERTVEVALVAMVTYMKISTDRLQFRPRHGD